MSLMAALASEMNDRLRCCTKHTAGAPGLDSKVFVSPGPPGDFDRPRPGGASCCCCVLILHDGDRLTVYAYHPPGVPFVLNVLDYDREFCVACPGFQDDLLEHVNAILVHRRQF